MLDGDILCWKMKPFGPSTTFWQDCWNTLLTKFNNPNGGGDRDIDREILPARSKLDLTLHQMATYCINCQVNNFGSPCIRSSEDNLDSHNARGHRTACPPLKSIHFIGKLEMVLGVALGTWRTIDVWRWCTDCVNTSVAYHLINIGSSTWLNTHQFPAVNSQRAFV